MIRIKPDDILNGKIKQSVIDKINNELITEVNCYLLELTELPNWSNVKKVACYRCPMLDNLPNWSNIEEVSCSDCPGLSELPNWFSLKRINCSFCPGLLELPNWPNVEIVRCNNCTGLLKLPSWPNVKLVDCTMCPSLTKLPSWLKVEEVYYIGSPIIKLGYMPLIRASNETLGYIKLNNKKIEDRKIEKYNTMLLSRRNLTNNKGEILPSLDNSIIRKIAEYLYGRSINKNKKNKKKSKKKSRKKIKI